MEPNKLLVQHAKMLPKTWWTKLYERSGLGLTLCMFAGCNLTSVLVKIKVVEQLRHECEWRLQLLTKTAATKFKQPNNKEEWKQLQVLTSFLWNSLQTRCDDVIVLLQFVVKSVPPPQLANQLSRLQAGAIFDLLDDGLQFLRSWKHRHHVRRGRSHR